MTAVSNTSPVCYLVLIGAADLLPVLFRRVLVPQAVIRELLHEDAPPPVRAWASTPPPWLTVENDPGGSILGLEKLQTGEQATILLAEAAGADIVLLDEKPARRLAENRGLRITGTLGVLAEAAGRKLIELPAAVDRLTQTNFRYSPALMKSVLDRFARPKV